MSVNKVILIGRTGADPHMFQFENGGVKAELSIATNETYIRKDTNEKVTTTEWTKVVFNGKPAEIIEKYVKKGDLIYIEGRLKTRKWTDQSGVEKYTTEVICNNFQFLSTKGSNGSEPSQQSQQQNSNNQSNDNYQDEPDDLPF